MIELKNIVKRFGKLTVVNDVSLNLWKGQCIALIGPNGCGKTTVIKSILGMVIPQSGDIFFNGTSIRNDIGYRSKIGYMPQIGRYPENMTIGQIIDMVKDIRGADNVPDEELYHSFDLKNLLHKRMGTLSGGTTQKVSATLAFMFNPDVLILDEPTAGLDPIAAEILKEKIMREKAKGKLILITSHILSELDNLVSQIIFMQEGNVLFHKNVDDLQVETGEDKISGAIVRILKNSGK